MSTTACGALALVLLGVSLAIYINGAEGIPATVCVSADTKSILIGVDRSKKYARSAFMPSLEGGVALIGTERERSAAQEGWMSGYKWLCTKRDIPRSEIIRITMTIQEGAFSARSPF